MCILELALTLAISAGPFQCAGAGSPASAVGVAGGALPAPGPQVRLIGAAWSSWQLRCCCPSHPAHSNCRSCYNSDCASLKDVQCAPLWHTLAHHFHLCCAACGARQAARWRTQRREPTPASRGRCCGGRGPAARRSCSASSSSPLQRTRRPASGPASQQHWPASSAGGQQQTPTRSPRKRPCSSRRRRRSRCWTASWRRCWTRRRCGGTRRWRPTGGPATGCAATAPPSSTAAAPSWRCMPTPMPWV